MKKLATLALALGIVAMMAFAAVAQPLPHDVGVFADEAGTMTSLTAVQYVPTHFYVVGFELDGLVKGFEWGLTVPAGMLVTGPDTVNGAATFLGPNPLNIGGNLNVIVGTGGCVDGLGAVVLGSYDVLFTVAPASNSTICIGPSDPSSLGGAPAYLQCDGTIVPMGLAEQGPDGCMVLNGQGPIPNETTSFSEVKARF
jgi:hypothetical protein